MKDFLCVFVGDDHGRSGYTGELWDLVDSTNTVDVIRLAGRIDDLPAAYAACTLVLSAALQEEGLQRAILEAAVMARGWRPTWKTACTAPIPARTTRITAE